MPFYGFNDATNATTTGGSIWTVSNSASTGTTTNIITSSSPGTNIFTGTANQVGLITTNTTSITTGDPYTVTGNIILTGGGTAATDLTIGTNVTGNIFINGTTGQNDIEVWNGWNQAIPPEVLRRMDPEERRRIEEQRRRWEEERQQRAERERVANEKAERLLVSALSEEQQQEYRDHGHFHVRSAAGRLYRVTKGWSGNVKLVPHEQAERGEFIESLCIHPTMRVPICDNMLAQKLMIEASEDDFRRIANIADLQRYRRAG